MRYLHTMVRVSNLDETLDFYCGPGLLNEERFHILFAPPLGRDSGGMLRTDDHQHLARLVHVAIPHGGHRVRDRGQDTARAWARMVIDVMGRLGGKDRDRALLRPEPAFHMKRLPR